MTSTNITRRLADFVAAVRFEDIPAPAVRETKRLLLDSLGCALAGTKAKKGQVSLALARRLGGTSESTVIGSKGKVSCATAAFANGELIHALDYCAILRPAGHVPSLLISAPLALAEAVAASGKDLIVATALAHEITTRLSVALSAVAGSADRSSGKVAVRNSVVFSVIGGAAAAAKILKMDAERISHAVGIAGYLCPVGVRYKWAHTPPPSMIKHAPAGWTSQAEVTAALLAENGFAGDTSVLDGEHGFWTFIGSEAWDSDALTHKLGQDWKFHVGIQYKRYPCCFLMGASALGMFYKIIEENNLAAAQIERVKVLLRPQVLDPVRTNREIRDHVSAQLSIPYPFAVAAHRIRIGAEWQEAETITNPKIIEFMQRVEFGGHPYYLQGEGKTLRNPAVSAVEVRANGRLYREESTSSRAANLGEAELVAKFRNNASGVLSEIKIDKLVNNVLALEKLEDVNQIMASFAP